MDIYPYYQKLMKACLLKDTRMRSGQISEAIISDEEICEKQKNIEFMPQCPENSHIELCKNTCEFHLSCQALFENKDCELYSGCVCDEGFIFHDDICVQRFKNEQDVCGY